MTFGRIPISSCVYGHKSDWEHDCSICWEERAIPQRKQPKKTAKLIRTKKVDMNAR